MTQVNTELLVQPGETKTETLYFQKYLHSSPSPTANELHTNHFLLAFLQHQFIPSFVISFSLRFTNTMADAILSPLLEQLIIFAAEEMRQQGKLVSVG